MCYNSKNERAKEMEENIIKQTCKEGVVYLNATKTAREFSKEAKRWLELKETKEYIGSLKKHLKAKDDLNGFGELVVSRKGGNDKSLKRF
jgi:sensor histidine kinase regulating citrate/malate metabolism